MRADATHESVSIVAPDVSGKVLNYALMRERLEFQVLVPATLGLEEIGAPIWRGRVGHLDR